VLEEVAAWLRAADHVTALTGAGISTDSGIPDYRGPNGLWTKNPGAERLSTLDEYMRHEEVRIRAWQARAAHPVWNAQPNAGHRALAELERLGGLNTLVTQNIDGLHQLAGSSPEMLIEIHGTMREVVCMACEERAPMRRALERVAAGEQDPPCRTCGGILKSATISFGQSLVARDVNRAAAAAVSSDVFLAIGTSLTVNPVAVLPRLALDVGAKLVIINAQPTPYDEVADVVVRDAISAAVPRLVELM
jgi:NAD-dependent protein deacetylase/lipoamidase